MKFVCVSDTHDYSLTGETKIPDGDVLIHAGDATRAGTRADLAAFDAMLASLPHPIKIFIPGNHDFYMEKDRSVISHAKVLIDEELTVGGLRIWGSPYTPEFFDWAFMLPRGSAMQKKWAQVPDGIDILVTHGPPHGILDLNKDHINCGCEALADALVRRIRPKYHIFGHIHESYGTCVREVTTYINASLVNEHYQMAHDPVVFEM